MNQPDRACPVCLDDKHKKVLYRQKFSQLAGQIQLLGYDVTLCENCGNAFADHIPGQDWFNAYYREISKYTADHRAGEESPVDTVRFRDIAELIAGHLPDKQSRIFDFGCATGGLLQRLKSSGYKNLLGMDKSPSSAKLARELYGIRVINSDLPEIAQTEEPFDLLIQVGVLEHISDVRGALAEMRSVIRPGGLMYIEVPDAEGFADWPGAPFQQFSIEHINFFSRSSLTGLMLRTGFEPVEVIRTARDHTANTKMPVVCGFYRMVGQFLDSAPRDNESEPALLKYIGESSSDEARVRTTIDSLVATQKPILVWGVGTHTLHLMETTDFDKLNIAAFVDSNTSYQAHDLHGRPVLAPTALKDFPHPILISSQMFQSEILDQIERQLALPNETITLYKA